MEKTLTKKKSLFFCSITCLFSCAVSPTLRAQHSGFVYVTNNPTSAQPGSILSFAISDHTGALTPVPGSPFPACVYAARTMVVAAPQEKD